MFVLVGNNVLDLQDPNIECLQHAFTTEEIKTYLNNSFNERNCFRQARVDISRMKVIVNGHHVTNIKSLLKYKHNINYKLLVQCCTQALAAYPFNILSEGCTQRIIECTRVKNCIIVIKLGKDSLKFQLIKRLRVIDDSNEPKDIIQIKIMMKYSQDNGMITCKRIFI